MGSILAPFRPSGPLCFPVRQRAFSASGGRAAAATGAAGGFYVSLCLIVQTAVQKLVENYCFSRVSEGTLGSFWARFWRRSVLQGHCVSLSGSVRSQLREEEQQQQQEQQEGSMSHYVSLYKQRYKKLVENYCFSRVSEGTLGSFLGSILALFRPSGPLCFPVRQRAFFQLREEEQQQQQEQQESSLSHYVSLYKQRYKKMVENYCFSRVSEGTLGSFGVRFWRCSRPSGPLCFPVRQRPFSASGGRAAAATGAAGGFYVLTMSHCTNSGTKNCRKLLFS